MPEPIDTRLYAKAKQSADRRFGPKTSLYKSSYMVHQYIAMGGRYRGKRDPHHGIVSAFQKLKSKTSKRMSRKSRKSRSSRRSKRM
jgi:hypothetical protein